MLSRMPATLLLLVLLIPAMLKMSSVFNYAVNYASYLELCENKSNPSLQCNGKCQLMKEIRPAEQLPSAPIPPQILQVEPDFFFSNPVLNPFVDPSQRSVKIFYSNDGLACKGHLTKLIVPPRV